MKLATMIGVLFGSTIFATAVLALVGRLLTKLRAPAALALAAPLMLLFVLVFVDMATSATPSAYITAKLFGYVLAASLAFRPMRRWLSACQQAAR